MSKPDTTVIIFALYGEANEQGKEVGRVTASTYKWAPSNAFEQWVLDTHPPEGRYVAVALEGTSGYRTVRQPDGTMMSEYGRWATLNIFTLTYPFAIVTTNRSDRPIGKQIGRQVQS